MNNISNIQLNNYFTETKYAITIYNIINTNGFLCKIFIIFLILKLIYTYNIVITKSN